MFYVSMVDTDHLDLFPQRLSTPETVCFRFPNKDPKISCSHVAVLCDVTCSAWAEHASGRGFMGGLALQARGEKPF